MIIQGYSFNPEQVTSASVSPIYSHYELIGYTLTIRTETGSTTSEHDEVYTDLAKCLDDLAAIDKASYKQDTTTQAVGFFPED